MKFYFEQDDTFCVCNIKISFLSCEIISFRLVASYELYGDHCLPVEKEKKKSPDNLINFLLNNFQNKLCQKKPCLIHE